jgi:hypothetical protein
MWKSTKYKSMNSIAPKITARDVKVEQKRVKAPKKLFHAIQSSKLIA